MFIEITTDTDRVLETTSSYDNVYTDNRLITQLQLAVQKKSLIFSRYSESKFMKRYISVVP